MKRLIFTIIIFFLLIQLNCTFNPRNLNHELDDLIFDGDKMNESVDCNIPNSDWWYFALQDTSYSKDWILYENMGIRGKTYSEVIGLFGNPDSQKNYILKNGYDDNRNPDILPIYLNVYDNPRADILHCIWNNVDTFRVREIYFINKYGRYFSLWGFQYNSDIINYVERNRKY